MPEAPRDRVIFVFERIDDRLLFLPLAARRALDECGVRLTLQGWRSMSTEARKQLSRCGAEDRIDRARVLELLQPAAASTRPVAPTLQLEAASPPTELTSKLGPLRPIEPTTWSTLRPVERYALVKVCARGTAARVSAAYDELIGARAISTHLSAAGDAKMVDVADKAVTRRRAVASCRVHMSAPTLQRLANAPKGDVLAAARIAGIMAAKKTADLIPLCHSVATTSVRIDLEPVTDPPGLHIHATAETLDRTGVEMEAMVGASVAALTVYDMLKGVERGIVIDKVQLEMKEGGRSGRWERQC
ncbi:MAG: cyclic pyranopterin monophosphate synthase MoaC [Deltaproteobacteria bacterium]|nr:cyclic pyranopterin monophosphate synthase MoaC [Deltaproteobacteria bacterium]